MERESGGGGGGEIINSNQDKSWVRGVKTPHGSVGRCPPHPRAVTSDLSWTSENEPGVDKEWGLVGLLRPAQGFSAHPPNLGN